MSSRSKTDSGEYEFTRAAYDEMADAERRYQVEFEVQMHPTPQRGVWYLTVAVRALGEPEGLSLVSRYQGSWPNSHAVSYASFLYQCVHRCCRMVEAWWKQREEDEKRP